jgi:hypothetical protein
MNLKNLLLVFSVGCPLLMQTLRADASVDSRFGAMTHFAQGWNHDWAWIASMRNIGSVRDELYWNQVETQPGVYTFPAYFDDYMDTLRVAGITPLIVLDFENPNYDGGMTPYTAQGMAAYAQYGVQVLNHYGSEIKAVEIWNEYNGTWCTGPATLDRSGTYTKMLQQAYTQIKAVRPDVTVVGGSTINVPLPYWEKLMQDGALSSMDALSIHPYRYNSPPEGIENDVIALQNLTKKYNNGQTKPIWVTEIGWAIQDGSVPGTLAIDEPTQAKFLVRAFALLLSVNVQRIYWYLLHDDQDIMGLTTPDATPRQSAYAMQIINTELAGATFVTRESTLPGLYSMLFTRPDGTQVRVMWSLQPTTVTVSGQTRVTDMVGNDIGVSSQLNLGDSPVYVEGPLQGLPPAPPAETLLTDSTRDFSGTQGQSGWWYGAFVGSSTALQLMTNYAVTDWTQVWGNGYPYNDVTPGDQHPSSTGSQPVSAVRRWVSTTEGTLHVVGQFQWDGGGGDGVGVSILINGQPLFRKLLGNGNVISYAFDFLQPVHVGTTIDFAVDPGPGIDFNFDATSTSATITLALTAAAQQNLSSTAWVFDGTPPVTTLPSGTLLADSVAGFSGTQGLNGWSYGDFVGGTTTWNPMPSFAGNVWGSAYPYNSVSAGDQHPSVSNNQQVAVVRRWTSTYAGTVHVTGQFQCGTQGDGVGVSIYVNGQQLFRQLIGGGTATQYNFDLTPVVQVGSTIDFAVDPGPALDLNFDATALNATITTN